MKKLLNVTETNETAWEELLGETITIICLTYIYTGKLIGINGDCILLEDPSIVYETGPFSTNEWKDSQALPNNLFVHFNCIESFGIIK